MAATSGGFALLLTIFLFNGIYSQIPDKRLCADSSCKGVISFAVIKESYIAKNDRELSLNAGSQISITSKNVQESDEYWGGEINGKHGFFPASYVLEQKVFNPNPKVIVSTQTTDSNDFSDMAKAYDEMTKANVNQVDSNGAPPPATSQSTDPPKPTGGVEETEEEEEGEEGDEEYDDEEGDEEGDEGDEEGEEEEEGDETEEPGTQPDGTESANDPTEVTEEPGQPAEGTKPEETKPEDTKPAETKPEEKQAEAADSATPAPPEANGGLLSSIGSMFGGMFGGKEEAKSPPDVAPADTGAKEPEAAEQPPVSDTDAKEAEKSETPEGKAEAVDPTEAVETGAPVEEEGVDDKLRTIQEEQLAKIRSNFLRRRTQPSATKEEVDDINKLLEKKYKRMEEPIQRIRAPSMMPTDGGSTVNAEIPRPDPEKLKENLAAQQAQLSKELEQQKQAELNRQWEIEIARRRQEELKKAQEKLIQEETARKIQEEAVKKAQEEAAKKAQEEALKKAQEEAAKKAQEEAAKKAQEEDVRRQEAAKRAQEEAAKKAQEEAARKAQEDATKKAQEEAAKKAQEEAAKKAQEEDVRRQEAAKKAQEEAAKKAQEEAAKKAQEEAAKKAQEEAAKKAQEEDVRRQEAAKKAQEEAAKKAQEEAARKAQEEALKKAQEQAVKKAQEEAAKKAEEEAAKKAEAVKNAQEEATRKAQEEAAKKAQEAAAKKAQEEAAKKVELEMQAAKLRDEQLKQEELQKQKQQQAELLHRQEEMRREKEIQRNLQQQQKAPETKVQDGGQPVVAPNQHPPLASTQPGNVPASPVSAMPTTREGAEPNQQSIVDDMALPHGSTTGKDSGETPEVQVTEALTQPPATVSIAASTTPSLSPVASQQQTLSDVMATAVPTPTPPDAAGSRNHAANNAPEALPDAGLLQPSTPTPAENIRPSVSIVPATETTQVPGNPGEGASPGEEAEEGFEEAEEGEEEEEGGEEEEGEEEEEAPTSEDTADNAEPEKPVQPTPTKEEEEMEKTITGADGLRSVVFDGTTMPLEDEPVVAPTAVPEVASSIPELSPSMTEQVMVATPPLEASLQATQSSPILSMSDMPSPSPSEMLSQHTEQVGGEAPSGEGLTDGGVANATGPTPPNGDDQHIPTPAWEQKQGGQHDPYTPGDFMSRRFLQSETIDTPEMLDNMKNEQSEESATMTEPDHEPVPPTEERTEPEGQEDPEQWEEPLPEMVTPSAPEEEDPLPPTGTEDFDFVTPPTVNEEEEQQDAQVKEPEPEQQQPEQGQEQAATEGSGGVVGNFVGALDGALKFLDPLVIGILAIMPSSVANFLDHEPFGFSAPRAALISLFSFSFLTLGVISYCMALCGGKRRDPLAKVSALEDRLFVTSKERDDLLQAVDKMKVQIEESKNRSTMSEGGVQELKSKLQTVQLHMAALQNTSTEQEMKIKELTGQNAEYTEVVAAKDGQLEQYMYQVNQYSEQLNTTNTQLQESWQAQVVAQEQTASYQVQVEQLTEEVTFLTESKDQFQLQLEGWSEKVTELCEEIKVLTEQQKENEKLLAFKDSEMEVMRDCFLQLKAMQGAVTEGGDADNEEVDQADGDSPEVQEKIKAMMDVSKVNASLKEVTEERDTLRQRLQIEIDARKEMEDDMEKREKEIENLREGHRQAEVQSQEATTKLNVLASYFKEKEVELQTSLGEQVVKSKASQNQLTGFDDKVKRTEEEMASYRAQVDDLKKEIENVERDFRAQVATNEKKAHENWLAARQAERDLKEAKNEAAMLRQKLLDMERKQELSGPAGLIRPLPTRAMPPPGVNGPPPPGMMPLGPPPMGPSPHAMGDRPMSRGTGIPPSPHMRDDHDYMPPPMRGRPPMMMDRPPPPPGSRGSPPPGWSPAGRGRSPPPFDRRSPPFDRRSPPPFDRRGSPPPFDRRGSPPPFDRRGPPPPHDRRSPPPMFRGPPPPDRRGPPPPGYRSPDGGYRRTPPHGRPYPPDQPPPPDYRKGGLDPRASDLRMMDPRTSSPYERPSSSASRNTDVPPHRNSQNMI